MKAKLIAKTPLGAASAKVGKSSLTSRIQNSYQMMTEQDNYEKTKHYTKKAWKQKKS